MADGGLSAMLPLIIGGVNAGVGVANLLKGSNDLPVPPPLQRIASGGGGFVPSSAQIDPVLRKDSAPGDELGDLLRQLAALRR